MIRLLVPLLILVGITTALILGSRPRSREGEAPAEPATETVSRDALPVQPGATKQVPPPLRELAAAGEVPADRAWISVRVPPEAVIIFGNCPTEQKGTDRLFESPPLPPGEGRTFVYAVTAIWTEDSGREHKEVREIRIRAGAKFHIDFTKPG
jgi:uncharacterized protein (TIGR03000 family)